ncbi:MAG: STAS domain-containing protein [Candidatus Competibacterales bacterium]
MDAMGMVFYAKHDRLYILKFVGDIRYTLSCALDDFLDELFARNDFDGILLDLSATTYIDSTNLGLLAKISRHLRRGGFPRPTLYTTNDDITTLLTSMGFDQAFTLCADRGSCLAAVQQLAVTNPSKGQLTRTLVDAHHALCDLSEANREKFQGVLDALDRRCVASTS